ncbi:hypothetical protein ADIMK_3762 [Marinobacterium lacunae]|uniref:Uncharacterized protein n=1 Tax=Marinobacterium lacunae TaxID=1232683 RepID=A0A081FU96_9GAMM|nr:hypothetical protein [Marinobacterium lacunae]KEA62101.1 hypothetical protein ADIMK_3762 [Marinobacterium lacunae]
MRILKLLKTVPGFLAGIILGMGVVTTAAVYAVDGNPPGLFELDGNTYDAIPDPDGVGGTDYYGDDWDTVYTNPASTAAIATTFEDDPAPETIYWKGGSKDIENTTEWWHKDGSVPDKDDITNAYAAAYVVQPGQETGVHSVGDLIIYFGLDRYANDGDAFAGFWFFQNDISANLATNRFDSVPAGGHVGKNEKGPGTPGDILVLVEYPQGSGATPEIKVYQWDPTDAEGNNVATNLELVASFANAVCDGTGGTAACAITNVEDNGVPAWPYTPKGGLLGDPLPHESFFEGGINVTELLGSTPCISSFLAETRSSRSETAQLKDFVLKSFDVCGISVTKTCIVADLNAAGDQLTASFQGTVSNDGGISIIANLLDTFGSAVITDVCYDVGGDGSCAGDQVPTGLTGIGTNDVEFDLGPTEEVLYLASYSTTTIPGDLQADNSVEVYAYTNSVDVGNTNLAVASSSAQTYCEFDVTPGLEVIKDCTAELNAAGDSIHVTVYGSVNNTGNVALNVDSIIDTEGDVTASDFPAVLAPDTDYPFSKEFDQSINEHSDTLTVTVTPALGSPAIQIAVDDDAFCEYIPVPELVVTKECVDENDIFDGSAVTFTIQGTVHNPSAVALENVDVVDSELGDLLLDTTLAPNETKNFSKTFSPDLADLVLSNTSDNTRTYVHSDTVQATGDTVIDALGGSAYASTTSNEASADCDIDITTDISVTKSCSNSLESLDIGNGITVVVVKTDVEVTVKNEGNEVLNNLSIVDTPDVVFSSYPSSLDPGQEVTVTGSYYPASSNSPVPHEASFSDMVDVSGDGIFTTVDASASVEAICDLCVEPEPTPE